MRRKSCTELEYKRIPKILVGVRSVIPRTLFPCSTTSQASAINLSIIIRNNVKGKHVLYLIK
jgi:hypothetical protein